MFNRRPAPRWLLVRPGLSRDDSWQWCCMPDERQGDWPPAAGLAYERVALVLPAAWCSHFMVSAPPGLKRHEWPQLLEDVLQQPAEQVQVNCLGRFGTQLELLVVERARIEQVLQECEALGLLPDAMWAEPQLLPQAACGEVLSWNRKHDRCRVRGLETGAQQWLVWPPQLGELPADWAGNEDPAVGDWPAQWADLQRLPNLLERPLARRSPLSARLPFSRLQRRLATTAAVLALAWGGIALVQFAQQVPQWKAQVQAVTGPVSNPQQAARALKRVQGELTDWQVRQEQLLTLEGAVLGWLEGQRDWGVAASHFDGRTWRLVLSGAQPAPTLDHWQTLARSGGAQASLDADPAHTQLTVRFDLGAQP